MALSMYRYLNNFRNKLKQKQNLDTLKINYIVKSYTWQSVAIFVNSDISQFPKCLRSYMGFTSTIFPDSHHRALKQKFGNIKRVIRRSKWKKNRQHNNKKGGQKTNNCQQSTTRKLKIEQHEPHRARVSMTFQIGATRTTQSWR